MDDNNYDSMDYLNAEQLLNFITIHIPNVFTQYSGILHEDDTITTELESNNTFSRISNYETAIDDNLLNELLNLDFNSLIDNGNILDSDDELRTIIEENEFFSNEQFNVTNDDFQLSNRLNGIESTNLNNSNNENNDIETIYLDDSSNEDENNDIEVIYLDDSSNEDENTNQNSDNANYTSNRMPLSMEYSNPKNITTELTLTQNILTESKISVNPVGLTLEEILKLDNQTIFHIDMNSYNKLNKSK